MFVPADRSARFSGAYDAKQRYYGDPDDDDGSDDDSVVTEGRAAAQAHGDTHCAPVPDPPQASRVAPNPHAPDRQVRPTYDVGPFCPWPRVKVSRTTRGPTASSPTPPCAIARRTLVAPWPLGLSRPASHLAAVKMLGLR